MNQKGFTFVEALISISIVGIFLALTWATVTFLLVKSGEQIVRTRGHFLAMEGIEITKQIRQTAVNRDRETGFLDSIGSKKGNFVIVRLGDSFTLQSGVDEWIEMNEEPFINYCRTITLTGTSDLVKEVISTVSWGGSDCTEVTDSIRYSTYLADIKK